MTWTPQPESGPERMPSGGRVGGVLVCQHHLRTMQSVAARHKHMTVEGLARRVAQEAAQCRDCLREQREES